MIGVSHASWSNWEGGRYNPSVDSIKQIADTFGVTKEWLETGLGEKTPQEAKAKEEAVKAKKRDEAVTCYNREDEERLRDIETVIRYIKQMDIPKERKRHIHRTLSQYRTDLENIVLFGEIKN